MSNFSWWHAAYSLTPVAAWDASRVSGTQLLDAIGGNHITATSELTVNESTYIGVAGNSNPMTLTTPVPIPSVGVVAGFWSPKRRNVLLSKELGTPHYALHLSDDGNGWYSCNYPFYGAYGRYGDIGKCYFVAMVTRGTDSILYVDGNLVGNPLSSNDTMSHIGLVGYGYGGAGNEYNLDSDEFFHALGVWTGEATQDDIKLLEAAARFALDPLSRNGLTTKSAFGFAVANNYGKVLVSSDTKTLHYIGKATFSQVLMSSSNCGGMYRWLYTINCIDYPTPFLTANGGYTAVTSVRPGNNGWILEVISTSPSFVEVYIFAPARSATFTGTHGVRVMKRDGSVAFDSRGKPLSIMASEMMRPPSSVRYGAISGTPWFCRSMPNSTLTPEATNTYYPNFQSGRSIAKPIFYYGSVAQAEIEQEFTTGRWGEGGWFDKREYQLWSTYWGFYRAGVKVENVGGITNYNTTVWVRIFFGNYYSDPNFNIDKAYQEAGIILYAINNWNNLYNHHNEPLKPRILECAAYGSYISGEALVLALNKVSNIVKAELSMETDGKDPSVIYGTTSSTSSISTTVKCGWVPVDAGCYSKRYESGRSIAGFNVGGGGTSEGGTWPFQNQTINLQPTLLLISDGSLYDAIGEVPIGPDDPRFRQGGGYGSWETMTGEPFYVHFTGPEHYYESPEAAFADYLAKKNAAALQRWNDAQPNIPEGYPNPPADSYVFTELREITPVESIGAYVAKTWQVLTDTAPDGTVSEPYAKMTSEDLDIDIGALQLNFVATSDSPNVPTMTRGTALAALAAHCAARWALGDCTDLWEILLVPAYDTTDISSVPEYGSYLGSYKIRINGVESLVQNIVVSAAFPANMIFPPPMPLPP